jgi:hypothetical protein
MIIGIIVIAAIGIPLVWWLAAPLFIQESVDEEFPFDIPSSSAVETMSPTAAETAVQELLDKMEDRSLSAEQLTVLEARMMEMAAIMPDHEMAETMPETAVEWIRIAQGNFRDFDDFHRGSGSAAIFQQGPQRVLRFEDFEVTNGPDLHVLLVENVDATGRDDLGNYIDLGSLKGNIGNQNYEIAEDVNLDDFNGVMIYCQPFHVVFSTAPLP